MSTRSTKACELWKAAVHVDNQIDARQIKADGSCVQCSAAEYEGLKNAAEHAWQAYHVQITADSAMAECDSIGMTGLSLFGEDGISNAACNLALPLALVVFLIIIVVGFDLPVDWQYIPRLLGF